LDSAHDILALGHFRAAVNRAYYTIFHAASAVLLWHDVERSRHSGVQSAFGEMLVKPGIIEPEFGRIYTKARKAREEQDYELLAGPLTKTDAEEILNDAENFITRMERYLNEVGATQ
jgi:uncharacterized protein (UPF0332 family)